MLLLRTTLLLFFTPLFFSSASTGLFSSLKAKPTAKSKGRPGWSYWNLIPNVNVPLPSLSLSWRSSAGASEAQIATTMTGWTTEGPLSSSDITTRGHMVSVEGITIPTSQLSSTRPEHPVTSTLQVGARQTQRGPRPTTREMLRGEPQTKRSKPLKEPHTNYDLEFWPGRPTESFSSTALPMSSTQEMPTSFTQLNQRTTMLSVELKNAQTGASKNDRVTPTIFSTSPSPVPRFRTTTASTIQNSETEAPQNNRVTPTIFSTSPSSVPSFMTTPSNAIQNSETEAPKTDPATPTGSSTSAPPAPVSTSANATQLVTTPRQPATPTSLPSEGRRQPQPDLGGGPELPVSGEAGAAEAPSTATVPHSALRPGDTIRAASTSPHLALTTSTTHGRGLASVVNLTHTPLPTISSLGGIEVENDDATPEYPTVLTANERGRERSTATTSTATLRTTGVLATMSEDWLPNMTQESALPDCNAQRSGVCNFSGPWAPTYSTDNNGDNMNTTSSNQSQTPVLYPSLPMFVSLYSDWNSAMATWGLAWEAHVYGLGTVFCLISLASALNLLCLPLCCPSGCGYFALVSLFLLAAGCTRAFALLYDAYGHQDRMASTEALLLLYEAPFPCMTAAFGLVFLLLSMRSRMQLSYSAFQRPCFLACLVLLHFAAAFGPVALLRVDQQGAPLCLFLSLISRGAFVVLATFLSVAYFVFYCYVRADSKHIYHLNNTSPTPAERYNRCPFAESQDWERAAAVVFLSAIFSLACAGLQLYAMLHALGLGGGAEVFRPWPWWAFQLSCRVCEVFICLTLALVVSQPIYCSDHLPQPGSCWMELLATKSPIIPGSYQWTLNQQEKLAICDPIGHGETECLPLYTLVDEHMGSLNGLDLLYHSNRALAYRDLDLPDALPNIGTRSVGSSCTSDSTADLRPPSPINLRRSIDEALFSEALFPMSLFSAMRPFTSSDHSLDGRDTGSSSVQTLRHLQPSDPGLYRTSSCVDMLPHGPLPAHTPQDSSSLGFPPSQSPSASSSCCSSPEHWKGSSSSCSLYRSSLAGSSLVLCSSPEGHNPPVLSGSLGRSDMTGTQVASQQRQYRTPSSQETLERQTEFDHSVQDEFISVCRQIDALSVCSETIDL